MSAVAATESPIVFLGTGEHFEDLEPFDASSFVKRLLGLGDMAGLMRTVNEAMSTDQQKQMIDNIKQGKFSLRDMCCAGKAAPPDSLHIPDLSHCRLNSDLGPERFCATLGASPAASAPAPRPRIAPSFSMMPNHRHGSG